jgi:tRNA (guanine-N7-)-methyltransferase
MDWCKYFGPTAPLELEIGFGGGEYLVEIARRNPNRGFIGIEVDGKYILKSLGRIHRAGLRNVKVLWMDGRVAIERLFRPQSLNRVYAFFPVPWPREKRAKHRLFSKRFLKVLNNRLAPEAEVRIITDHTPYARWVIEQVPGTGFENSWRTVSRGPETRYERKWVLRGQKQFQEIRLQKQYHLQVPMREDAALVNYHIEEFDPVKFQPRSVRDDCIVSFKEWLFDAEREKGMLRVVVIEDDLTQNIWIQIARAGEKWHIRVAPGNGVLPTDGVQRAMELTRDAAGSTTN